MRWLPVARKPDRAGADVERNSPGNFNPSLSTTHCRVEKAPHRRDAVGRKANPLGVFSDNSFVRGEVDAVNFVAGYITMEPLDLGPQSLQNVDRLLGDFP